MAILNDVEVRVVSKATGQSLDEYDKPDSAPAADDFFVEKYVEAKTGEDFAVEIRVKEGFDYLRAWGIRIGLKIDGGVVSYCRYLSKENVAHCRAVGAPVILDSVWHSDGKVHSRIGFQFGSLNMNEEMNLPQEELEHQAKNLGLISVYVERVNMTQLPRPKKRTGLPYKPLSTLEAPKELIKDKRISSIFQPGKQTPASDRRLKTLKFTSYMGSNFSRMNFHFYYRSEMHLRLLHCLPWSPIPDPPVSTEDEVLVLPAEDAQSPAAVKRDPAAVKAELEETAENNVAAEANTAATANQNNLAEENLKLRQQLVELQNMVQNVVGGFSTAMQTTFGTTLPTPTAPLLAAVTQVKREWIKEEDDKEPSNQATHSVGRPTKRSKIIIELE